jgi:Icc-related predicted phosphoesterase
VGPDSAGQLRPRFEHVGEDADVLLVAGDLTKCGTPEEADLFADELSDVSVPIVVVLGNHDHHDEQPEAVAERLRRRGLRVLEGDEVVLDVAGHRLGVAGVKGFGGGFAGASGTAFGEVEMKAFIRHSEAVAERLRAALERLAGQGCASRVALMHYAPVPDTLAGEPREIYPFLGSEYLGEAVDLGGADLALHGHAHAGTEHGVTPGGVPVRNVALPVVRTAYRVYELGVPAGAAAGER